MIPLCTDTVPLRSASEGQPRSQMSVIQYKREYENINSVKTK